MRHSSYAAGRRAAAPLCAGLVLSLLAGGACRRGEPGAPAGASQPGPGESAPGEHKDEEAHAELPTRVRLAPEVVAAAGLVTAAAVLEALPSTVELSGELAADPDRTARITARVPGRIVAVRVKEGQKVAAGELLAVIESPELLRVRAAYVGAQARGQSAEKNAERLGSLLQSGLAAEQEARGAAADARALKAEESAAARTLASFGLSQTELTQQGARLELRAPLAGYVVSRDAVVGQWVPPEHALFDVSDLDRAYFVGRLFEKSLARVQPGQPAEVRLSAYPDVLLLGTVESIGRRLDPVARTVVARIVVKEPPEHPGLLKIGLFGTARVSEREAGTPDGGVGEALLVVPLTAVVRLRDKDVVFVRQPDGHFEVHPVTLGRSAGGRVQVLSGLRAGEQVVVQGAFTLKSAVLKATFAEEE
ncbi:MAG: efflux RND transporter periplasmic adaptor subunit [Polyangia bacterium]